jgi:hypothetical protein
VPDPATIADFTRRLSRLWLALFAAALAIALYAALERRGLHADGASYLMRLVEREIFDLAEPARRSVMVLLQAPALAAIRLGWVDLAGAGFVFCLTLELVPLLLLALSYAALPAERKHFFYFPLLHYLAAGLSAAASPIAEGIAAAAYFWLLFYLVLFRPLGAPGLAAVFALAVPVLWLHEAMGGLSLALAAAAAWRLSAEPARPRRAALAALALWFLAMAALHSYNILVPHSAANRAGLIDSLAGGWFLLGREGEINIPAWAGLFALLVVNALPALPAAGPRAARGSAGLVGVFAALAAAGVGAALLWPATVAPGQQFASRVNPAIVSLLLSAGVLGSLMKPARQRWWARRAAIAVCAILGASCLAWHAIEVRYWSIYLGTVRGVLAESRGLVLPRDVAAGLGVRDRAIVRNMSWHWAFPELSLVLAPAGKVSAIIARERPVPWKTWDPREPDQVPRSRFFDISPYRAALARPAR